MHNRNEIFKNCVKNLNSKKAYKQNAVEEIKL